VDRKNRKLTLSLIAASVALTCTAVMAAPASATATPVAAVPAGPQPAAKPAAVAAAVVLVAEVGKGVAGTDIKDYADLISRLKDNPDCYTYGTTADGTRDLNAMAALQKRAGVRMVKVSYKDTAAAIEGLMKAKVQLAPLPYDVAAPYIQSGQMRPLVVLGSSRIPQLKDTPAITEVLPGFVY
jgi:tripartite-type tricarboxylate transporter receptor subunit TctC